MRHIPRPIGARARRPLITSTSSPPGADATFVERLRWVIRSGFGSTYRFAQETEFSESTVKRWLGRSASQPDARTLVRLSEATGISIHWLLTGRGPELPGAPAAAGEVGSLLRETLLAEVRAQGSTDEKAELMVPAADNLLEDLRRRYVRPERASTAWIGHRGEGTVVPVLLHPPRLANGELDGWRFEEP